MHLDDHCHDVTGVGIAQSVQWLDDGAWFESQQRRERVFSSPKRPDRLLGPSFQWLPGLKRREHNAEHTPPSSTEVKNEWGHGTMTWTGTFTVFMVFAWFSEYIQGLFSWIGLCNRVAVFSVRRSSLFLLLRAVIPKTLGLRFRIELGHVDLYLYFCLSCCGRVMDWPRGHWERSRFEWGYGSKESKKPVIPPDISSGTCLQEIE